MRVHDCNWKMLEEYLGHDDRIVLPIGSTEQHGYLSVGTDAILAERVAVEAAEPRPSGSSRAIPHISSVHNRLDPATSDSCQIAVDTGMSGQVQRMGPMRHEASSAVQRPIEEVWAFLTDRRNLPRWSPAWLGARLTSTGPFGRGTTFQGRMMLGVLPLRWTGVVTEWDPPHVFSFTVNVFGAQSTVRLTLMRSSEGIVVTRVGEREPRAAQRLVSRILGRWLRHHHASRDEAFRRFVEAGLR